jgi:AbrB family looped-hinge helix DNA binding protein
MKMTPKTHKGRFTTRGRFTIPVALRKKYGLKGGERLAIEVTPNGGFILKPFAAARRA